MSQTNDTPLNHHLWKNGNVWWVAYTVHLPGWRKSRFRQSLGTTDVGEARRRRDALFFLWGKSEDAKLSLRFQPPRGARGERPQGVGGTLQEGIFAQRQRWESHSVQGAQSAPPGSIVHRIGGVA